MHVLFSAGIPLANRHAAGAITGATVNHLKEEK